MLSVNVRHFIWRQFTVYIYRTNTNFWLERPRELTPVWTPPPPLYLEKKTLIRSFIVGNSGQQLVNRKFQVDFASVVGWNRTWNPLPLCRILVVPLVVAKSRETLRTYVPCASCVIYLSGARVYLYQNVFVERGGGQDICILRGDTMHAGLPTRPSTSRPVVLYDAFNYNIFYDYYYVIVYFRNFLTRHVLLSTRKVLPSSAYAEQRTGYGFSVKPYLYYPFVYRRGEFKGEGQWGWSEKSNCINTPVDRQ